MIYTVSVRPRLLKTIKAFNNYFLFLNNSCQMPLIIFQSFPQPEMQIDNDSVNSYILTYFINPRLLDGPRCTVLLAQVERHSKFLLDD